MLVFALFADITHRKTDTNVILTKLKIKNIFFLQFFYLNKTSVVCSEVQLAKEKLRKIKIKIQNLTSAKNDNNNCQQKEKKKRHFKNAKKKQRHHFQKKKKHFFEIKRKKLCLSFR